MVAFALDPGANGLLYSLGGVGGGKGKARELGYATFDVLPASRRELVVSSYALHAGLEALFAAHAENVEAMDVVDDSFAWTKARKSTIKPSCVCIASPPA